ncbi:hypothetical protein ACFWAP_21730 [Streptomyces goshikiensis]|uniref:hypothetical protein n=1 Tax=Streptomyces goshikiensis TaxID=1942 RepID=UPI003652C80E
MFTNSVPDLANMRDALEHFNAYEKGKGKLQTKGDVWSTRTWLDTREGRVLLFVTPGNGQHWSLDVQVATAAAGTLVMTISKVLSEPSR